MCDVMSVWCLCVNVWCDVCVMSVCRVFSCVVGRACLLWPVYSLGKTLLAFALLHFVLQGDSCLLLQVSFDFLLLHFSPLYWKGHVFWGLVLEDLVELHRTVQIQPLLHYWLWHKLRLLWYLMVCLGNEQRTLCFFFEVVPTYYIFNSCWLWGLLHFF